MNHEGKLRLIQVARLLESTIEGFQYDGQNLPPYSDDGYGQSGCIMREFPKLFPDQWSFSWFGERWYPSIKSGRAHEFFGITEQEYRKLFFDTVSYSQDQLRLAIWRLIGQKEGAV